jgi:hypothetical protein
LKKNNCRVLKKIKSFRPPFLKAAHIQGAEPWSPSAEGETPLRRFFLPSFLFAPTVSKKKRTQDLCNFTNMRFSIFTLSRSVRHGEQYEQIFQ